MAPHVCHIVPAYILHDIANGPDPEASRHAAQTLEAMKHIHQTRATSLEANRTQGHQGGHLALTHQIVPDYVLDHIANAPGVDEATRQNAANTLAAGQGLRQQTTTDVKPVAAAAIPSASTAPFTRMIYDLKHKPILDAKGNIPNFNDLPGQLVRSEGQAASKDPPVNEVYDNCLTVLKFFQTNFGYNSLNGQNMPIISSVHFATDYVNAFWLSADRTHTWNQMVYGDGGKLVGNFTKAIDVIGHEMTVSIFRRHKTTPPPEHDKELTEIARHHTIQQRPAV